MPALPKYTSTQICFPLIACNFFAKNHVKKIHAQKRKEAKEKINKDVVVNLIV